MTICAAVHCSTRSDHRKDKTITLHRFPRDKVLRDKWIKAIKRANWIPNRSSLLCSIHFEDSCFNRSGKRVKLLPDAEPTLFPSYPSYFQKQNSKKMVNSCSAFGCTARYKKGSNIGFFRFPKYELRRKLWINALRRADWTPSGTSLVCGNHFQTGRPSKDKNHPDYVPNCFIFSKGNQTNKTYESREAHVKKSAASRTPAKLTASPSTNLNGVNSNYASARFKPAALEDRDNPDCVSSVNLGHDSNISNVNGKENLSQSVALQAEAGRAPFLTYAQAAPVRHTEEEMSASHYFKLITSVDDFVQPHTTDKETENREITVLITRTNEEISSNDVPLDNDLEENDHGSSENEESCSNNVPGDNNLEKNGNEGLKGINCKRIQLDNVPTLEEPIAPEQKIFPQSYDKEDIFGVYIATEMKSFRDHPVLYLKTKQAIIDALASSKLQLVHS